jgi:MFS transporter, OFA family, oxalate/formate antiporter
MLGRHQHHSSATRWIQLVVGIVCMIMIANLQYGWTLFVHPLNQAHGWALANIQVAFSIFVALETWLTPIDGWIVTVLVPASVPSSWSPPVESLSPSHG